MRFLLRSPDDAPAPGTPSSGCPVEPGAPRAVRWLLAGLGLVSLGIGVVGIWVPGLPTTVFLIVASWLFTRSCPALDRWMRSLGPVQPFLRFVDGEPIPGALVPWILLLIWLGGAWGAVAAGHAVWSPVILVAAGVGTAVVTARSAWFAAPAGDR